MGKEFVSGYCQLVTGEKDPRNLRLAFSIERVILVEFDISENVEVRNGPDRPSAHNLSRGAYI